MTVCVCMGMGVGVGGWKALSEAADYLLSFPER
jgi:hypothetical protein